MANLAFEIVTFTHKEIDVRDDATKTVGQQVDQAIADIVAAHVEQHGHAPHVRSIKLDLTDDDMHKLWGMFDRRPATATVARKVRT